MNFQSMILLLKIRKMHTTETLIINCEEKKNKNVIATYPVEKRETKKNLNSRNENK